jgi:hypothetical protein
LEPRSERSKEESSGKEAKGFWGAFGGRHPPKAGRPCRRALGLVKLEAGSLPDSADDGGEERRGGYGNLGGESDRGDSVNGDGIGSYQA